jgi:FkbM family methyltransferase
VLRGREPWYSAEVRIPKEHHGPAGTPWRVVADRLRADSVVYSCGVGTEIGFDLSLIERYDLTVYGLDPTPRSVAWIKSRPLPGRFVLVERGVGAADANVTFYPPPVANHVSYSLAPRGDDRGDGIRLPVRRLATIMAELGHSRIDLLKLDVEGSEYPVIRDIVESKLPVGQLLVEFHHRLPQFSVGQTREAIELLRGAGFRIFDVAPSREEYGFIHGSLV